MATRRHWKPRRQTSRRAGANGWNDEAERDLIRTTFQRSNVNFDLFMVLPRPAARITLAAKLESSSKDRSEIPGAGQLRLCNCERRGTAFNEVATFFG